MNHIHSIPKSESLNLTNPEIQSVISNRCKSLKAPIAIVGSRNSSKHILKILKDAEIIVTGIYDDTPHPTELGGKKVQPIQALSTIDPQPVVLVASLDSSIELEETLQRIQNVFPGRVLCLEHLLDLPTLFHDLKIPLDYKYNELLLSGWRKHLIEKPSPWQYLPPDFNLKNKTVLEFGPFEGHFSMMLMEQEPKRVIGLEGRSDNYAKTALLKAYMDWDNYTLRFGDMHLFPSIVPEPLDVIFCSGVLYHSEKPWWFLETCMNHCDTIILSSQVASKHSPEPRRFKEVTLDAGKFSFEIFSEGGDNLSGLSKQSLWFHEEDLAQFVEHHGFHYEKFNEWVNPHGLWICSILNRKS